MHQICSANGSRVTTWTPPDPVQAATYEAPPHLPHRIRSQHRRTRMRDQTDSGLTDFEKLINIMQSPPKWAEDLPLRAEAYVGQRYRKG